MGFMDSVKRSLGYEVDESNFNESKDSGAFLDNVTKGISDTFSKSFGNNNQGANVPRGDYVSPQSKYEYYDDFSISPEYSLYELILIRPKSLDDINYIIDQVLDNNNPVIVDLSFLQRESPGNFRIAGEKIKKMRTDYDVESFLISRCDNRNRIIIAPKSIKIIKKD